MRQYNYKAKMRVVDEKVLFSQYGSIGKVTIKSGIGEYRTSVCTSGWADMTAYEKKKPAKVGGSLHIDNPQLSALFERLGDISVEVPGVLKTGVKHHKAHAQTIRDAALPDTSKFACRYILCGLYETVYAKILYDAESHTMGISTVISNAPSRFGPVVWLSPVGYLSSQRGAVREICQIFEDIFVHGQLQQPFAKAENVSSFDQAKRMYKDMGYDDIVMLDRRPVARRVSATVMGQHSKLSQFMITADEDSEALQIRTMGFRSEYERMKKMEKKGSQVLVDCPDLSRTFRSVLNEVIDSPGAFAAWNESNVSGDYKPDVTMAEKRLIAANTDSGAIANIFRIASAGIIGIQTANERTKMYTGPVAWFGARRAGDSGHYDTKMDMLLNRLFEQAKPITL